MIQLSFIEFFVPIVISFLSLILFSYCPEKFITKSVLSKIIKFFTSCSVYATISLVWITPAFILIYYFYLPNIYVVKNCNVYEIKKLINPNLKINNIEFEFEDWCYVVNESDNILYYDELVYGHDYMAKGMSQSVERNLIINPNSVNEFHFKKFDFFLQKPPQSITSKYTNELMFYLGCQKNN